MNKILIFSILSIVDSYLNAIIFKGLAIWLIPFLCINKQKNVHKMRVIKNYSDFQIPIVVYGSDGLPINPLDASILDISVFTNDISTALSYDKNDIDASTRTISIDGNDSSILENGALYYKYYLYLDSSAYPDNNYQATKKVQTDVYIMNRPEEHKLSCATMISELINDAGYITLSTAVPIINEQVDARVDYDISTRLDNYATKSYVDASVNLVRSQIPTIPTNVSAFVNDKGYLTQHQSLANYPTKTEVSTGLSTKQNVLVSGTNIKTINNQSILGAGNIDISTGGVSPQDLSLYATKQWVEGKGYLTQHQDISGKADKSYVDASVQAVRNEIPSLSGYATQSWVQNQGYLTQHQSLADYATKVEVSTGLSSKQNTLTAGTGIAINNDTISVTLDTQIYIIVEELPATGVSNKIYLVPKLDPSTYDEYDEYMWINNEWELIGSIKAEVDLSAYLKISDASLRFAAKTEIPTVPTNVSAFTNDAGYLTQHQSLADYATKNYVDSSFLPISGGTTTGSVMFKNEDSSSFGKINLGHTYNAIYNDSKAIYVKTYNDIVLSNNSSGAGSGKLYHVSNRGVKSEIATVDNCIKPSQEVHTNKKLEYIWVGSQVLYDLIETKDASTLYIIT